MPASCLVNGRVADNLSVFDRGLLYGQGLFETIRFVSGHAPLWRFHMQRLADGCVRLGMAFDQSAIETDLNTLLAMDMPEQAIVKILITAGRGERGYRAPKTPQVTRIVQCFARQFQTPEKVDVTLCQTRLMPSLFAGLKHCNRLEQVQAAAELSDQWFEGLLADNEGNLIEATSANVFWVAGNQVYTPPVTTAGVAGVMRAWLLQRFPEIKVCHLPLTDLSEIDALALVNSNFGVLPVDQLTGIATPRRFSPSPVLAAMTQAATELFGRDASLHD